MKHTKRHVLLLITTSLLLFVLMGKQASAKTLTLLLDLSGSNPLLLDEHFNRRAAAYVVKQMDSLEKDDSVEVRFIGGLNDTHNFQTVNKIITRHNLQKVKGFVARLIVSLPAQTKAQGSTNLVAFWGRNRFDCSANSQIIALTDAIEASEYVSPKALLSGKASLPKPNEYVQLKGCHIAFFGVGVGRSDKEALILRRQWQRYFNAAGATFKGIAL